MAFHGGGRGRRRKFPVANFFRNSWLTQHSARIMSKIVEISAVKSTLCTAVEENLLSIPKIELNALSEVLILYIYIIYFTSNLIIFLIKKKKMWIRERNLSWKYFEIINNKRSSKFIIIIHSLFIPWLLIVNK